jgi:hypothetical protein
MLGCNQSGRQFRRNERNIFEVARHLSIEPTVNPQRGFVDLVVMSRVADGAIGLGMDYGVIKH